jgi:ankyrin repeat protein
VDIDQRAKQRGEELKADDQLFLASEMIRQNQVDELKKILKNWTYPIDRIHSLDGTSLLHVAVWNKKTGIARMLVEEYHANVNVADKQNDTPLDYAEYQKAADLVEYLKSKGAKANKQYGKPPAVVKPAAATQTPAATHTPAATQAPAAASTPPGQHP